jgi:ribosomal protein S18 acetylase RimI-like enzyme
MDGRRVSQVDREWEATKVRIASADDAARISEIHVHAWQAAYRGIMPQEVLDNLSIPQRQEFWKRRLTSGDTTVFVAVRGALLIGWLVYGNSRDDDAGPGVIEVYGLYVDPRAWRSGVGRRLWAEAMRRFRAEAVDEVTLWVLTRNVRARAFYEALGFRPEPGRVNEFEREGAVLEEIRYRIRV